MIVIAIEQRFVIRKTENTLSLQILLARHWELGYLPLFPVLIWVSFICFFSLSSISIDQCKCKIICCITNAVIDSRWVEKQQTRTNNNCKGKSETSIVRIQRVHRQTWPIASEGSQKLLSYEDFRICYATSQDISSKKIPNCKNGTSSASSLYH